MGECGRTIHVRNQELTHPFGFPNVLDGDIPRATVVQPPRRDAGKPAHID
jgi:hypothetical protein